MKAHIVLAASLLSACAPVPPAPLKRIAFPEAEYLALPRIGTGVISGQGFLRTRGGDVKTAAGSDVLLNPVTSYSLQWYEDAYQRNVLLEAYDPRLEPYLRKTIADADGRFTFDGVPAGEYFVVTRIIWEAPNAYTSGLAQQGGFVAKRVAVHDDQRVEVIVTR
ncbi:hypothetical protein [Hydrocarboniphaga sp.]|uniref:hypothetical protein n=1 Tax=Hydrocarboniphaga sp. TaxID=2033016 RepID=UPI003D0EFB1C